MVTKKYGSKTNKGASKNHENRSISVKIVYVNYRQNLLRAFPLAGLFKLVILSYVF